MNKYSNVTQPMGYDSAMGFNNAKGANHMPAKRGLNDMASRVGRTATFGTTTSKVLGGSPKDFNMTSKTRGKSYETLNFNSCQSNPMTSDLTLGHKYSDFSAKQVPNTSPIAYKLSGPNKVISSMNDSMVFKKSKPNGQSMIFHKKTT